MSQLETERKTVVVPGHVNVFEHQIVLLSRIHPRHDCPHTRPLFATCITRRPATRCECFMYALEWRPVEGWWRP
jgi:hypothetical protein